MRNPRRWLVLLTATLLVAGLAQAASAESMTAEGDDAANGESPADTRDGDRDERKRPHPQPKPSPRPGTPTTTTQATTTTVPTVSTSGNAKFDILVRGGDNPATRQWWDAPYVRDLYSLGISQVPGVGWTDGDRAGYKCAYMFLYQNGNENDIIGRVTFTRVGGYAQINDQYMKEFVRAYDGGLDYTDQSECPGPSAEYQAWDGADYRPKIFYTQGGQLLENRSYTNTSGDAIDAGALKFREYERITTPFTDTGGISTCDDYCTVYGRVTVMAYFQDDSGEFFPAVAIYYDSLSPDVALAGAGPGGFEPSQPAAPTPDDESRVKMPPWWRTPARRAR
jgi:hypothetical protein